MPPAGRTLRRAASPLLVLALLALPGACARGRFDPARQDVVLIVIDTLRADHLGAYGYPRPTSPVIDALARRGTVFDSAWAAAPWTLPSVMSIVTGRHPSSHRVENDGLKLAADVPTLAEVLRAEGFATAAFVSHVYVSGPFGFARGFEAFEDFGLSRPGYRLEAGMEPPAGDVTGAALGWLRRQGRRPVFLLVHYFDPHWPYAPPASDRALFPSPYAGPLGADYDSLSKFQDPEMPIPDDYRRFLIDRYDGEIHYTDRQVGRLLDGLEAAGRGARAWVVLTADHGEEFKEHGSMGHGRQLYEEVVRVPLVIGRASPGATGRGAGGAAPADAPARVSTPVAGVDLFPTVVDLAGARRQTPDLQGMSLAPLLRPGAGGGPVPASGEAPVPSFPADRTLVSETVRLNAYLKAARQGPLKFIHSMNGARRELYDLTADPGERRDLWRERPDEGMRLARALFAEVDFLSGGWNLIWKSDGRKRRFQGQIETGGIFRTVVPLSGARGQVAIRAGKTLTFTDDGQPGWSGLSFTTAPYEAQVEFYLLIDDRPLAANVFLGGERIHPKTMPFVLQGDPTSEAAFHRPDRREGAGIGYYLWRVRPTAPGQEVVLDAEIRERLRSLGYVN